jgi:hypothetical protein
VHTLLKAQQMDAIVMPGGTNPLFGPMGKPRNLVLAGHNLFPDDLPAAESSKPAHPIETPAKDKPLPTLVPAG